MQPGSPDSPEMDTIPGYIPSPDSHKDSQSAQKNPYHDKMNVKGAINHSDEDIQMRIKKQAQLSACSSSTMDSFIQDVPYVPSPIAVQYDNTSDTESPQSTQEQTRSRGGRNNCCANPCAFFGIIMFIIVIVAFTFAFIAL